MEVEVEIEVEIEVELRLGRCCFRGVEKEVEVVVRK